MPSESALSAGPIGGATAAAAATTQTFRLGGLGGVVNECCCGSDVQPCFPCDIPKRNLTLTITGGIYNGCQVPLIYTPGFIPHWISACGYTCGGFTSLSSTRFDFFCSSGVLNMNVILFLGLAICTAIQTTCGPLGFTAPSGCDPNSPLFISGPLNLSIVCTTLWNALGSPATVTFTITN